MDMDWKVRLGETRQRARFRPTLERARSVFYSPIPGTIMALSATEDVEPKLHCENVNRDAYH